MDERAKSGLVNVKLPVCGLDVTIREIRGKEEDILASDGDFTMKFDKIFASVIVDDRPLAEKVAFVQGLTVVDRTVIMLAMRRASLGDLYDFTVGCPIPDCGNVMKQSVDLSSLDITNLESEETQSVSLTNGDVAVIRRATGLDEGWMNAGDKVLGGESRVSLGMLMRVSHIIRPGGAEIKFDRSRKAPAYRKAVDWISDLSIRDRKLLRGAIEKVEPKIDLTIELCCSACQHEWQTPIVIGEDFLFPSGM